MISLKEKSEYIFSNKALKALLIPLIIEQILNSLMGVADTMMVSRVGEAAISAVSNVDQINVLIIQLFSALATGAVIICSQYLGREDKNNANKTAEQVIFTVGALSMIMTMLCIVFCKPLLSLIYGGVEKKVMDYSIIYFFITVLSFPFIALFSAGSAFFRASGNARFPMVISVISNVLNIVGNAVSIFGFGLGVYGAAISTLVARVFCMVVVFIYLRKPKQVIVVTKYITRPNWSRIVAILAIGIPAGVENSMFQLGKLAIQSSVATLSTEEIAAQAMTVMLEGLTGMVGIGIGIGMMTAVGQAKGAGRIDEAKYYIVKLTILAELGVTFMSLLFFVLTPGITWVAGMSAGASKLCFDMMLVITIAKPVVWTLAFVPGYGLRAAGDVRFSMIASMITMWTIRVAICIYLIRVEGFGPIAVWIAMITDWAVRAIIYTIRFLSGRWSKHRVI